MRKMMVILGIAGSSALFIPCTMNAQMSVRSASVPAKNVTEDIEAKAEKQTAEAERELALNEDQKSKFKKFAMDRLYKIQPIQEKIKSTTDENEKEKLKKEREQINDEFIKNVNSILTPAQQELFKKKIDEMKKAKNHQHHHGK